MARGQLAPPNCFSENIRVHAVVVAELKLRDVQREILGADFVERSDHPALNQAPKAFYCLGMDGTDHILPRRMVNGLVGEFAVQMLVTNPLVCAEQANLGRDAFTHKGFECGGANIRDHASHDITFATDSASDDIFARSARSSAAATLVPMAVLGFATDESLIDFHNPHELVKFLVHERSADPVRHVEGSLVRAEAHNAHDLERANALLGREHHVDHAEPDAQGLVGILEDGSGDDRKPIAAIRSAGVALPLEGHRGDGVLHFMPATGASDAIGPAVRDQIGLAGFLGRESLFPLGDRHLVDRFGFLRHGRHSLALEGI